MLEVKDQYQARSHLMVLKADGKPALGVVVEVRKWKKSPIANIVDGNKVDEVAPDDIVKAAKQGKYKPPTPMEVEGSVRVYWRGGSGIVNVYRYGADGKYDVDIYDTSIVDIDWDYVFEKTKQQRVGEEHTAAEIQKLAGTNEGILPQSKCSNTTKRLSGVCCWIENRYFRNRCNDVYAMCGGSLYDDRKYKCRDAFFQPKYKCRCLWGT